MVQGNSENIVILDFGSQYTQLIARRVRELGVYCEIHPCHWPLANIKAKAPKAIILSGGPSSVLGDDAPQADVGLFELGVPVLGICYGQQWLSHVLGGKVEKATHHEYGPATIRIKEASGIFARFKVGDETPVWMSHGDRVISLPEGYRVIAESTSSPFAGVAHDQKRVWGVQFHPEVMHTARGKDILSAFLFDIAKCQGGWTSEAFVERVVSEIKAKVGTRQVVCALSGGVDSSVAALLVNKAIGKQLHCVFVDNGLMRKNEAEQVRTMFQAVPELSLKIVDASEQFLGALKGVSDPEEKRKIIGRVFIEVFEHEAHAIQDVGFLVQGTLYPDVIESVSVKGPSAVIKSHHNVGGLPETMKLDLIEPLRELFKDEVRRVGLTLGLPKPMIERHPFPGPGLGIRVLGALDKTRLDTLREADAIFIDELHKADLYNEVWQAFSVLLPVKTVGVMGDERTYSNVLSLRAVSSVDGMTADWSRLPHDFLARVSSRIINEVRGINRVVYDISSKPPATIEWE